MTETKRFMSRANNSLGLLILAVGCLVLFVHLPRAAAQSMTGTIIGSVHDNSGALVPNAMITVTNLGNSAKNVARSNDAGDFTLAGLTVGSYSITVAKQGFKTFQVPSGHLGAAQTLTVNAVLSVGSVTSEVTVTGAAEQIQTSSSENSSVVSEEQIADLPLNGRNYQGLASLMPGVVNVNIGTELGTGGRQTRNSMATNGMGTAGTLYLLDGVWDENTGNMAQTTIQPNPDQIDEVRVYQNNFSPKDSLLGASVVMITSKSGTRQFHGVVFEYFRNDALDARNFFSTTVPALKQNIFGGTLGGPIFIPGKYNSDRQKTFFFLSQQGVFRHSASVELGATPTADMRQGIFNSPIIDPETGQPFPQSNGNWVIPSGWINQQSVTILNALASLPNDSANGFNNFENLNPTTLSESDSEIKLDHNFTSRQRFTGEYFDTHQYLDYAFNPDTSVVRHK
jgi:hypothetical protein